MVQKEILRLTAHSNATLIRALLATLSHFSKSERELFQTKTYFGISELKDGLLLFISPSSLAKNSKLQTECDILYHNGIGDIVSIELRSDKLFITWTCWDQDGELIISPDGKKEIISFRDHEQWRKNKSLTKAMVREDFEILVQELNKKNAA